MSSPARLMLAIAWTTTGCAAALPIRAPAPKPPERIEPSLPATSTETLAKPPPDGKARVVLDSDGERAAVWHVTAEDERQLCVTPCFVDIQPGSHRLWFTSAENRVRSSRAVVSAPADTTTIVRHALGVEGHPNQRYAVGTLLVVMGAGLALVGSVLAGVGAFGRPAMQEDGTMSDPEKLLVPGVVTLGLGSVTIAGGSVLMAKNRPVIQEGATTTWTK